MLNQIKTDQKSQNIINNIQISQQQHIQKVPNNRYGNNSEQKSITDLQLMKNTQPNNISSQDQLKLNQYEESTSQQRLSENKNKILKERLSITAQICDLQDIVYQYLEKFLEKKKNYLQIFQINFAQNNKLTNISLYKMLEILEKTQANLKSFSLISNNDKEVSDQILSRLENIFTINKNLQKISLNISNSMFQEEKLIQILNQIKNNSNKLQKFYINTANTQHYDSVAFNIAKILNKNNQLQNLNLNLNQNFTGNEALNSLSISLKSLINIKKLTLCLAASQCKNQGINALSSALQLIGQ
ncbi:hypothetical protein PPERSA_11734 [Pseudocohnilembus persalinus]|uniref:Kinase domain protein n=1 Tax=Pseudocohnilembus persalinus TaxID=266149 RepID=A0A0V0QGJ1_PSEPJ|nr:hypothetical protein PPERSA_11734 [Pseudocohnilembus persalinus]|eukprot:KRX01287.1 hypothetical protein PPERSA_11734 [Pseudocohnilembus persalinus]